MLELDDVNTYYGDSHILHGVSLRVGEGEVVCLLGRNGAGKTTTILTVDGLSEAASRPHRISRPRHCRAAAVCGGAARRRLCAAGARHLSEPDRAREPHRVRALGSKPAAGRSSAFSRCFPSLAGARAQSRLPAVGRRAADAVDRAGADAQSEPAVARRAVRGVGAADRAADHRGAQEPEGRGPRDPAGRAESAHRVRGRRPPPCHQQGRDLLYRQPAELEGNEFVLRNYLSV